MANIIKDILMKEEIELDKSPNQEPSQNEILKQKIAQLNQDPTIAIVSKFITSDEELYLAYNKYSMLPQKFKRLSNQYSMQLFGYNVPNMYAIMRDKLIDNDYIFGDDKVLESFDKIQSTMENIDLAVINNDESLLEDIDMSIFNAQEKVEIDYEFNEAKKEILENKYYDFSDYSLTPWFTLDEEYCKLEHFEDPDYSRKVLQAMREYRYNPSLENCTKVLELGWNPSVEITKESIEYAKKRQIEYLKEHQAIIYDISKKNCDIINESSKVMRNLYKEKNIYPVYIVLSWTNTFFGKIIRFVKDSKYTHAGMTLDSDLSKIVTFKYDSISNGFEIENLKGYINTYRDCQIEVLCLFVDKKTKKKLEESLDFYEKAKDITKYGFKNLFNILLNRKKEYTPYDNEMVCSQFVDQILKLCDIDITGKANNLVIPQDYVTIASKNPKIYKVYEGYGKDYVDGKVEAGIKELIDSNENIRYKDEAFDLEGNIDVPLELAVYSIDK